MIVRQLLKTEARLVHGTHTLLEEMFGLEYTENHWRLVVKENNSLRSVRLDNSPGGRSLHTGELCLQWGRLLHYLCRTL